MKVFISWSGEKSRDLAELLREWIPAVIQAAKPYFTPDDVAKGSRWSTEIATELAESSVGIICLTGDNLEAPWIMFEAGSLAKQLEEGRVCSILFDDLGPEDLKGPLGGFQAVRFQKADFLQLAQSINGHCGSGKLSDLVLQEVFENWWPLLEAQVGEITRKYRAAQPVKADSEQVLEETLLVVKRGDHDIRVALEMLEELLALNRHSESGKVRTTTLDTKALQDLAEEFLSLKDLIADSGWTVIKKEEIKGRVRAVARALRKFVVLGIPDEKTRNELIHKFAGVDWDLEAKDESWGGSG